AGGLSYTLGAGCEALSWPTPWPGVFGYHEILHLSDMLGTLAPVVFVMRYVLPYPLPGASSPLSPPLPIASTQPIGNPRRTPSCPAPLPTGELIGSSPPPRSSSRPGRPAGCPATARAGYAACSGCNTGCCTSPGTTPRRSPRYRRARTRWPGSCPP